MPREGVQRNILMYVLASTKEAERTATISWSCNLAFLQGWIVACLLFLSDAEQ